MIEDDLEPRLRNWGRWLRSYAPQGRAMSAEGAFETWDGMVELLPPPRPPAPRYDDAVDVEMAVRLLPLRQHLLLKFRYVVNWRDDGKLLRAWRHLVGHRLSRRELFDLERQARAGLRDALEQPQVIRKARVLRIVKRILEQALDTREAVPL